MLYFNKLQYFCKNIVKNTYKNLYFIVKSYYIYNRKIREILTNKK